VTPRIGITALVREVEGQERTGVNAAYAAAVSAAGGVPLLLPPLTPTSAATTLLAALDGIVFSGGADIAPARYGAEPHPRLGVVEPERDAFEMALFQAARRQGTPTLAICRGFQLANVALGGTLWQDLPSERPGAVAHDGTWSRTDRVHRVSLTVGSRAAAALGVAELRSNSFHHQGIRDLAPGLRATGHTEDGLIEAFETADEAWLLGVQWHPEAFWRESAAPDLGLFRALIDVARG
jgi:putative glutamine amidotransferase